MSRRSQAKLPRKPGPATRPDSGPDHNGKIISTEVPPRWHSWAVCILLALAVWIVFGQTLHHEFVNIDDDQSVYEHPLITQGMTWHGVVQLFTHIDPVTHDWWPLSEVSHMLDWQLYGANAGGHHLTNVLLHAAAVILLFLVFRKMTGVLWPSAFVAAVFAIHPLRVESVAWVSERKDVLSGVFFMLTLWAYASYVGESKVQGAKSKTWYALALFFFACGLMSKSMLVTLPFVLLLLDYWPLNRISARNLRQLVLEKVPFLLLAVAAGIITLVAQAHTNVYAVQGVSGFRLAGNALVADAVYLVHMIYPVGLALYYSPSANPIAVWKIATAFLVLAIISSGALAAWRKHPWLLVGWLWYLGMLVPVTMIQSGLSAGADRYTYLPQVGLYIMMAWGASELGSAWRRRRAVLGTAAALIVVGLMTAAHVQAGYWKDSIMLWNHTLACTTGNYVAHNNLGIVLAKQGKADDAILQYQQALQFKPDSVEANNNLGVELTARGRLDEAIQRFELALQSKPDDADVCNNLGVALEKQGNLPGAIQQFQRVLQFRPDDAQALLDLGTAFKIEGRLDDAVQQYQRLLQLKPDDIEAHNNLGITLAKLKRFDEAAGHFQRVLQLKPDNAEAHYNLGVVLAKQDRVDDAIQQYQLALRFNPDSAQTHYNLGAALKIKGDTDSAAQHFQKALDLATAQNDSALANAIRARIQQLQSAGK